MKKIILISILAVFALCLQAQLPTISTKIHIWTGNSGEKYMTPGQYGTFNALKSDTLKSADTIVYIFPVYYKSTDYLGMNTVVYPFINQYWTPVAADTGCTITFWQLTYITSADPITIAAAKAATWFQIYNTTTLPVTLSAYSKTTTATTSAAAYSFTQDMAVFEGRYFAIRYIAKTKTGFKSIPYGNVRFNLK